MSQDSKKIALVTGASRGIGQAIAQTLGQNGFYVLGTATTAQGAEAITQALADCNAHGEGMMMDVASLTTIEAAFAELKKRHAMPAVLVNNAAITRDNLLLRMKEEEWAQVLATNLTSVFHVSKICLRAMIKERWGRIISIGSVVGSTGNPGQANYAAAKAGILGFTKSLASEVGPRNVTVNAVCPGFIDTDMTRNLTEAQREQILSHIPLMRMGQPNDVAEMVKFLASDAAAYVTGQTLHVNGGMYTN